MDLRTDGEASRGFDTPEDWNSSSLSAIAEKIADGEHLTPRRTRQGYLLLSARNVLDGCLDLDDVDYVGPDEYARIRRRCDPNEGDILISCSGSIGRVALVPPGLECVMVRSAAFVRINAAVANAAFIQYYLQSAAGQLQIANSLNQGAQANLFLGPIGALRVALPPLAEQKAIASALSDVDALLGALDRLIAKKRDLKQAAMQQLLTGQTRLPGFSGKWERVAVGELFGFKNGINKAKEFFGHGTPIVNYMDVYQGTGLHPANLPGRVAVSDDEAKAFDVRRGDVFFTRTSETVEEIGLAAVMLEDCERTVFSGFLLRARPKNDRLRDAFKKYCFRSEAVRRQIITRASYTTRALTNGRLLSAVLLDVPSREEQIAIADMLSDMDAELTALEQRRDKTRLLKQGMMQELLTGRTRLV